MNEHYHESVVEGWHVTILDFPINTNRKILVSQTANIIKYIKENSHKDLYEATKWQTHPRPGIWKTKQIQLTGVEKREKYVTLKKNQQNSSCIISSVNTKVFITITPHILRKSLSIQRFHFFFLLLAYFV